MFPWIPFLKSRRRRLSDTEFMAIKAFEGKAVTVRGAIDTATSTIEYVPANGKTFYFHSAKIVITGHITPATQSGGGSSTVKNEVEADLKIDSTVVDTVNLGFSSTAITVAFSNTYSNSNAYGHTGDGRFDVKGRTLEGNGSKKIEIESVVDDGTADAILIGWIEDTGTSPQV